MQLDKITGLIIDCARRIHTDLGPGLLESVYEVTLAHELRKRGARVETQVALPVVYDSVKLDAGFRIDLLVEGVVIVEIKSVESLLDVHKAQVITYLRLSGKPVALLMNFNVVHLKDGIRRFTNRELAAGVGT
jgi:GxxExxY protein